MVVVRSFFSTAMINALAMGPNLPGRMRISARVTPTKSSLKMAVHGIGPLPVFRLVHSALMLVKLGMEDSVHQLVNGQKLDQIKFSVCRTQRILPMTV